MADKLRSARDVARQCLMSVPHEELDVADLEAVIVEERKAAAEWMRERAKALGAFHEFDRSPTPGEFDAVSKALKQVMACIDAIDVGEMMAPAAPTGNGP